MTTYNGYYCPISEVGINEPIEHEGKYYLVKEHCPSGKVITAKFSTNEPWMFDGETIVRFML